MSAFAAFVSVPDSLLWRRGRWMQTGRVGHRADTGSWQSRCGSANQPGGSFRDWPWPVLQCNELFAQGRATRQGVGHFAEGGLDGLFVLRHGNVTPGLGGIERGPVAAQIENGQADLRQERPGAQSRARRREDHPVRCWRARATCRSRRCVGKRPHAPHRCWHWPPSAAARPRGCQGDAAAPRTEAPHAHRQNARARIGDRRDEVRIESRHCRVAQRPPMYRRQQMLGNGLPHQQGQGIDVLGAQAALLGRSGLGVGRHARLALQADFVQCKT